MDYDILIWFVSVRAIITYLVNKYAPGHDLYPTDVQKRAKIEAMLHFDNGLLFQLVEAICFPKFYIRHEGNLTAAETFEKHLMTLDFLVKGKKYLVGDNRTLADLSIMTTLTYLESCNVFDFTPFVNITKW